MAEVENFLNGMSLARFIKGHYRLTYSHFDEITRLPIIDFFRHRQNQNHFNCLSMIEMSNQENIPSNTSILDHKSVYYKRLLQTYLYGADYLYFKCALSMASI